jgi:hypothetical protein
MRGTANSATKIMTGFCIFSMMTGSAVIKTVETHRAR